MTPADKRVMELLDRWLTSIELHLKYAELDDVSYQQMQPWPKHERPARWILELAQQKVLSLQTLCKTHLADNDPSFAEALELMCFLANLVGAQHIQRFIPLAMPEREAKPDTGVHRAIALQQAALKQAGQPAQSSAPVSAPVIAPAPPAVAPAPPALKPAPIPAAAPPTPAPAARPMAAPVNIASPAPSAAVEDPDKTREMPRLRPVRQQRQQAAKAAEPPRRLHLKNAPAVTKPAHPPASSQLNDVVIADAVRLLRWGRQWHEIAELIARMAERPNIAEVRKILRSHKPAIEQQLEA